MATWLGTIVVEGAFCQNALHVIVGPHSQSYNFLFHFHFPKLNYVYKKKYLVLGGFYQSLEKDEQKGGKKNEDLKSK